VETKISEGIDLRHLLPKIQDQGDRGTCVAFAVTSAHERKRHQLSNALEKLSEEFLYWECKQIDGDLEEGTTFTSAAEALLKWGQPKDEIWPYTPVSSELPDRYVPPKNLGNTPFYNATLVPVHLSKSQVKAILLLRHVIVVGLILYDTFMAGTETIAMPSENSQALGTHAVTIVGYVEVTNTQGYFIIRNSWGEDWGVKGYAYLPYEYFDNFCIEAWKVEC
jgi:C1A family cysteine protease